MINKIWFKKTFFYYVMWPILWPLSVIYRMVSQSRRKSYRKGRKPSYRAPVPVVVVGNLTAGGNGKTPMVIWLVEALMAQGHKPGVVSRGYGSNAPQYPVLVDDNTSTLHCGDEPKLIQQRTGVPVAVDPNRSQVVQTLLANYDIDIVVTDDGLQHYALERDIEFVVVDGIRRFGNHKLLPLGPLREPITRLEKVDFIVTNGGIPKQGEIALSLKPDLAINLVTGEARSVNELTKLVAMAGIGHPPRFFATLQGMGAKVIAQAGFADHKAFSQSEIKSLSAKGQHLIMTEKDAVKCREFAQDNWWYLPVSAEISVRDARRIMKKMSEVIERYGSSTS
ncbi:MAG: tetraacyldisaccharide 4'-kinase [Vibrio sp.]